MKKVPMTNETPIEYHDLVESLAGELPSIPLIMNDLLKIITDSNAALFAIRDVIKNDKAIFSKILKFANNVEYRQGSAERITSISDAIQRLKNWKAVQILNLKIYGCIVVELPLHQRHLLRGLNRNLVTMLIHVDYCMTWEKLLN